MRMVRDRSLPDEIEAEQKLKESAKEKAELIENGDPDDELNFGVRVIKDLKEYFYPTIEV